MILVIAPTKMAYDLYREKHDLHPTQAKFVTSPDQLMGYRYEETIVTAGSSDGKR